MFHISLIFLIVTVLISHFLQDQDCLLERFYINAVKKNFETSFRSSPKDEETNGFPRPSTRIRGKMSPASLMQITAQFGKYRESRTVRLVAVQDQRHFEQVFPDRTLKWVQSRA